MASFLSNDCGLPLIFSNGFPTSINSLNEVQLECFLKYLWDFTDVPKAARFLPEKTFNTKTVSCGNKITRSTKILSLDCCEGRVVFFGYNIKIPLFRLHQLKAIIVNVYDRLGCKYLLHLSEGIALKCDRNNLLFSPITNAQNQKVVDLFDKGNGNLIVTVPQSNLTYDLGLASPKKYIKHSKSRKKATGTPDVICISSESEEDTPSCSTQVPKVSLEKSSPKISSEVDKVSLEKSRPIISSEVDKVSLEKSSPKISSEVDKASSSTITSTDDVSKNINSNVPEDVVVNNKNVTIFRIKPSATYSFLSDNRELLFLSSANPKTSPKPAESKDNCVKNTYEVSVVTPKNRLETYYDVNYSDSDTETQPAMSEEDPLSDKSLNQSCEAIVLSDEESNCNQSHFVSSPPKISTLPLSVPPKKFSLFQELNTLQRNQRKKKTPILSGLLQRPNKLRKAERIKIIRKVSLEKSRPKISSEVDKETFMNYHELLDRSKPPEGLILLPEVNKNDFLKFHRFPLNMVKWLASKNLIEESSLIPGLPGQDSPYTSTTNVNISRNAKSIRSCNLYSTRRCKKMDFNNARNYSFPKKTYKTTTPVPIPPSQRKHPPSDSNSLRSKNTSTKSLSTSGNVSSASPCTQIRKPRFVQLKECKVRIQRLNPFLYHFYTKNRLK